MSKQVVDIVSIIENNPIKKFMGNYGSKILERIRSEFSEEEQQLYVANLYCFLTYDDIDFVVSLDRIWKWLGYSRIDECKRNLYKNFKENIDYKINLVTEEENNFPQVGGKLNVEETRGRKSEHVLLTTKCFKKLCLKSRTDKADSIHDYYLKLEKLMTNLLVEQSEELYKQLLEKDNKISELEDEKKFDLTTYERNLIENLNDIPLIYIGLIGNNLVKFGLSRRIEQRITAHKREIGPNFILKYVVITNNFIQLEELIKDECKNEESVLYGRRISKIYNGKNQTELIQLDKDFTIEDLYNEVLRLKEKCENKYIQNLEKEIKELRSKLYDIYLKKSENLEETPIVDIIKKDIVGIKCSRCCKTYDEYDMNDINPTTLQPYSQCQKCRIAYLDNTNKRIEETLKIKEKEYIEKQQIIENHKQQLLNGNPVICFRCKILKEPKDMDIKKNNIQLNRICTECREKDNTLFKANDLVLKENETKCSKCRHPFPIEHNNISRTNYKTCKQCRQKDEEIRIRKQQELNNSNIKSIICIYCQTEFEKELNAKKDGFYKSCKTCREDKKKYDSKKYSIHREKILNDKKEYYQENREEIRMKQKEHYDKNKL